MHCTVMIINDDVLNKSSVARRPVQEITKLSSGDKKKEILSGNMISQGNGSL